jgi:hypothetical protein
MWGALSDEKSGVQFELLLGIARAAFLRSFIVLFVRFPQLGGWPRALGY